MRGEFRTEAATAAVRAAQDEGRLYVSAISAWELGVAELNRRDRPGRGRAGRMPDREKRADRLMAIRLRYTINTHLDDRGLAAPAQIGAAVGLPGAEAVRLLTRRQWREGDVAALQAVAARLGLQVPLESLEPSAGEGGTP